MAKKKWGDRRDAKWLKDIPSMNYIMPTLMPNRADNEAFITVDIELAPILRYLEKKNEGREEDKLTFFQLVAAAAGRAFVLRPKMNRFICNHKLFQKNDITVAFTVKKKFDDRAEEGLAYLTYEQNETIDTFHEKIVKTVHHAKKGTDASTGAMDVMKKFPHFLVVWVVKFVRWMDKHGWAPKGLIASDPNHASIFLSNLGSIGLEAGYHHLVNWGTNSCFIAVGKKQMKMVYDKEGNGQVKEILPLGLTLDERIADGYYYSGTVALVKELLAHPELMEQTADTPVEYAIKR